MNISENKDAPRETFDLIQQQIKYGRIAIEKYFRKASNFHTTMKIKYDSNTIMLGSPFSYVTMILYIFPH